MNDKILMKEIIEQRKLKGSSRKPKYATRKLSIGLVSCMLGFTLLVSPTDAWAEEATIVPMGTEETFDIVPQAEEPIVDQPVEESIFSEKQKQALAEAGYTEAEIKDLESEAKDKKAIDGEAFDLDEFVNDKIAEKQNQDLEFSLEGAEPVALTDDGLEKGPVNGGTAVRDAAPPIESEVDANANNAVHAYVGVVNGLNIDADLSKAKGNQFKPISGIKVYFQWFETWGKKQYSSPVYTATSGTDGQLHMGIKPYLAEDGSLIKFDADTTVSAGRERYRFWVDESTIPEGYQLQYITGESVLFPDQDLPITQGGSGSNTARNIHGNWKILLMQKPLDQMHKEATPTEKQHDGGYLTGTVGWDYRSGVGGIQWNTVADLGTPAKDVTVKASYLSDYALKQIYSESTAVMMGVTKPSDIRGAGWTAEQEKKLQDWIKEQVKGNPDKWIAETVSAKTNADGKYIIQFKGTWGNLKNSDAGLKTYDYKVGDASSGNVFNKWTKEQIDRLGTVADKANNGSFNYAGTPTNKVKHVNYDWLFVSVEKAEHLRVMTPYNNNQYTQMSNVFGISSGWSGTGFGVGVTNAVPQILRADFAVAPGEVKFNITNYDSDKNTAKVGDVAKTSTEGLPYNGEASENFRIVWYDEDGKQVQESPAQKPSSTGSLESADFDTSKVTKTTNFTAKLYRVDSRGKNAELLAQDSFTVVVEDPKKITSMYDQFEYTNPNPVKDATYSAKGLPEGLEIDPTTGNIKGVAKESGEFQVEVITVVPDESGNITASRFYTYTVTDSPLAEGTVNTEYNQKIVPTPQEGYVYKNVTAKFIDGKAIDGLTIAGDKITGTPTKRVDATQEDPNVEVTYDIYKLNDKGQEVLIKQGHVDKVPLSIKDKLSAQFEPEYTDADAQVGKPTTISAPNFKGKDGNYTTKPEGTTFKLGEGAPEGAKIDENTGKITYTPTEDEAGKNVEIPVVVTYKDGSTDTVNATVKVAPKEKSATPVINETKANATKITGTGVKGATVTVTRGEDVLGEATVKDDGTWEVTVPEGETLAENDVIKATQLETGKDLSDEAEKTVTPADKKTTVDETGKKAVEPTADKQGTGIKVTNPDNTTKVTAKDEDGKEIPAVINPQTGEIEVTPGTDVDGPITVTVEDSDLPGGKKEVVVDVNGHKKGQDDNNNGKPSDNTGGNGTTDPVTPPAGGDDSGSADNGNTDSGKSNDESGDKSDDKSEDKTGDKDGKDSDKTDGKTDGKNHRKPNIPDDKVKVKDEDNLTDDEKNKIIDEVKKANPDAKKVEIDDKGNVVLTYDDGFETSIPYKSLVEKVEKGSVVIPSKDNSHAQDPFKGNKQNAQEPMRNKRNQLGAKNVKTGVGSVSGLAGLAGAALAGLFVTKKKEDEDK